MTMRDKLTRRIDRAALPTTILSALHDHARLLAAIAAPPGAGKSTLAAVLKDDLDAASGSEIAAIVPMDGFHLDNAVLAARDLLPRKGAPETFDVAGFLALVRRLKHELEIAIPLFDRSRDLAIAGAALVEPRHRIVLVEGNYLLLDREPWSALAPLWDLSICLEIPSSELERRLVQRWLDHGLGQEAARQRALGNDIPNARLVLAHSRAADLVVPGF